MANRNHATRHERGSRPQDDEPASHLDGPAQRADAPVARDGATPPREERSAGLRGHDAVRPGAPAARDRADGDADGTSAASRGGDGLLGPDVPGGVTAPDASLSPDEKERKGVALRRAYARPHGPMADRDGTPGGVAMRAQAYGEPVPRTDEEARALADKGERLIREAKAERRAQAGQGSGDTRRPASSAGKTGKPASGRSTGGQRTPG